MGPRRSWKSGKNLGKKKAIVEEIIKRKVNLAPMAIVLICQASKFNSSTRKKIIIKDRNLLRLKILPKKNKKRKKKNRFR